MTVKKIFFHTIFFNIVSKFWTFFRNVYKDEKLKTAILEEWKCWEKILKQHTKNHGFLKVKNSILEKENYFIGLKDGELKERELKIKKKENRRTVF